MAKKPYKKPEIKKVRLKPEEAILACGKLQKNWNPLAGCSCPRPPSRT